MDNEKEMVARLYVARQASKAARLLWRKAAAELPCENDTSPDGKNACYYRCDMDVISWCDNCKGRTQYRDNCHAAASNAGAALTAVLRLGKKLATPNTN